MMPSAAGFFHPICRNIWNICSLSIDMNHSSKKKKKRPDFVLFLNILSHFQTWERYKINHEGILLILRDAMINNVLFLDEMLQIGMLKTRVGFSLIFPCIQCHAPQLGNLRKSGECKRNAEAPKNTHMHVYIYTDAHTRTHAHTGSRWWKEGCFTHSYPTIHMSFPLSCHPYKTQS